MPWRGPAGEARHTRAFISVFGNERATPLVFPSIEHLRRQALPRAASAAEVQRRRRKRVLGRRSSGKKRASVLNVKRSLAATDGLR